MRQVAVNTVCQYSEFSVIRLITDALFTLAGFAMGGTVGIGTLICVVLVGPVAGVFLPVNEKMIERITAWIRR